MTGNDNAGTTADAAAIAVDDTNVERMHIAIGADWQTAYAVTGLTKADASGQRDVLHVGPLDGMQRLAHIEVVRGVGSDSPVVYAAVSGHALITGLTIYDGLLPGPTVLGRDGVPNNLFPCRPEDFDRTYRADGTLVLTPLMTSIPPGKLHELAVMADRVRIIVDGPYDGERVPDDLQEVLDMQERSARFLAEYRRRLHDDVAALIADIAAVQPSQDEPGLSVPRLYLSGLEPVLTVYTELVAHQEMRYRSPVLLTCFHQVAAGLLASVGFQTQPMHDYSAMRRI